MTDRERIARDIYSSLYQIQKEEEIRIGDKGFIAHMLSDKLIDLGYTHQPEPSPDRVEAVRRYIDDLIVQGYGITHQVDKNMACARSILSLFPESVLTTEYTCICNTHSSVHAEHCQVYNKGKEAQLAHTQQQIKGLGIT